MYNVILPMPDNVKIDEKFLKDLDEDEFRSALSDIHSIFRGFYKSMAENPESCGIPAIEIVGVKRTGRDYKTGELLKDKDFEAGKEKTLNHYYKLQKVFVNIFSSVNSDMTGFTVDLNKFKVRKRPKVLERLKEQGFEIFEDGNYLHITYPDNKNIFVLFAAHGFSCVTWTNFAADKKYKNICIDFLTAQVFDEADKEYFMNLHKYLLSNGFTYKQKRYSDGIGDITIRYERKGKLEFVAYSTGTKTIKIRLANLDKYTTALDSVTEIVRNNILEGYFCRNCAPCKSKAYRLSYKGKGHIKCCVGNYHFYNTTLEDFPSIKLLMENELPYYLQ